MRETDPKFETLNVAKVDSESRTKLTNDHRHRYHRSHRVSESTTHHTLLVCVTAERSTKSRSSIPKPSSRINTPNHPNDLVKPHKKDINHVPTHRQQHPKRIRLGLPASLFVSLVAFYSHLLLVLVTDGFVPHLALFVALLIVWTSSGTPGSLFL